MSVADNCWDVGATLATTAGSASTAVFAYLSTVTFNVRATAVRQATRLDSPVRPDPGTKSRMARILCNCGSNALPQDATRPQTCVSVGIRGQIFFYACFPRVGLQGRSPGSSQGPTILHVGDEPVWAPGMKGSTKLEGGGSL